MKKLYNINRPALIEPIENSGVNCNDSGRGWQRARFLR